MTTADALLADIIAQRGDDTPRLILADWLEEHEDPARGEFIRVQVELAKLPPCEFGDTMAGGARCFCGCRRCDLGRRERELFQANDIRTLGWFGLPQPWAGVARLECFDEDSPSYPYAVCRRGLIAEIHCAAADWLAHGDAIVRQPVERVTLTTRLDAYEVGRLYAQAREKYLIDMIVHSEARVPRVFDAPDNLACLWPGIMFEFGQEERCLTIIDPYSPGPSS